MGTTLTNGIYLPNEGEKNCYAGLKTNWETLDQKIADITALQQAVAGALHREIVATLPTTDIDPNTIYMILSGTSATENIYDEYMYISNAWELIGTSATDLTNYYTKAEVDGKLLLKANASDLTSHTGDTTIHVTASDKSKWDTVALIKQLRLVNAQVGSATTIAFANIDDTNGIKVGDKCMDLDGKLFEITAVDTTNQTVTVGTALIDLAQDSNVVHKSGNETVGGQKTFTNSIILQNSDTSGVSRDLSSKSQLAVLGDAVSGDNTKYRFVDKNDNEICYIRQRKLTNSNTDMSFCVNNIDNDNNSISAEINFVIDKNNDPRISPSVTDYISWGRPNFRWKNIYSNQINGLTPSSLSMPSDRSARVDISGYFTNTANGDTNTYTVPANGWIYLNLSDVVVAHCFAQTVGNLSHYGQTFARASAGQLHCLFPVRKDDVFVSQWYTTTAVTVTNAYFIPCQGNV